MRQLGHSFAVVGRLNVDVPGWTGNYFLITPDMLGKRLSVRETVASIGYAPASATSDPTAPIIEGTFENRSKPFVGGDPIVGEPLTVSPGAWPESGQAKAPMAYAYRWFVDGLLTPGGTSATFTPSVAELGKAITVEVTVSSPGYTSAVNLSNPTPTVVEAGVLPVTPGVAEISGTPRMGGTLTASTYNWMPRGLTFVYEWLADGTTISGASGSTFKPTMAEGGKRISVKMTGSRARYASRFDVSPETAPVVTMTAFGAPRASSQSVRLLSLSTSPGPRSRAP